MARSYPIPEEVIPAEKFLTTITAAMTKPLHDLEWAVRMDERERMIDFVLAFALEIPIADRRIAQEIAARLIPLNRTKTSALLSLTAPPAEELKETVDLLPHQDMTEDWTWTEVEFQLARWSNYLQARSEKENPGRRSSG